MLYFCLMQLCSLFKGLKNGLPVDLKIKPPSQKDAFDVIHIKAIACCI